MIATIARLFLFVIVSFLQVRIVDAKDYVIPTEEPKNCVKQKLLPCAITTGNDPRMFSLDGNNWELDRNIVMQANKESQWNVYQGMLVLNSKKPQKLHTPFADIEVGRSKVMVHVLEDKVRVMALGGEGIKVKAKGDPDEHFLVPGFQNWYGGVEKGMSESGVVSVLEFEDYAQKRARFFMDHSYGYVKELQDVANIVKWAAKVAADMHRSLVERKMASLEEKHQQKIHKKQQKIHFNKYLRKLFLKKIQYDY